MGCGAGRYRRAMPCRARPALLATLAVAAALGGCGGDDPSGTRSTPAIAAPSDRRDVDAPRPTTAPPAGSESGSADRAPRGTVATSPAARTPAGDGGRDAAAHAAFVGRLDAICRAGNAQIRAANAAAGAAGSVAAAAPVYARAARLYAGLVDDVRRLDPPPADRRAFAAFVGAGERSATLVRRLAAEARDGEDTSATVAAITRESDVRRRAARALGTTECGRTAG